MSYHWNSKLGTDALKVVGLGHLDNLYMAHSKQDLPRSTSTLQTMQASPQTLKCLTTHDCTYLSHQAAHWTHIKSPDYKAVAVRTTILHLLN